jgi:hypothetical protein
MKKNTLNEVIYKQIIKELLLEATQEYIIKMIKSAIKSRRIWIIDYKGEKEIDADGNSTWKVLPGKRYVEIYALGTIKNSKTRKLAVRAWIRPVSVSRTPRGYDTQGQNTGEYHPDKLKHRPGWRLFRVDRIISITPTIQYSEGFPPKYNPNDKQLNVIMSMDKNFTVNYPMKQKNKL